METVCRCEQFSKCMWCVCKSFPSTALGLCVDGAVVELMKELKKRSFFSPVPVLDVG